MRFDDDEKLDGMTACSGVSLTFATGSTTPTNYDPVAGISLNGRNDLDDRARLVPRSAMPSLEERIEKWCYDPIRRTDPEDGFQLVALIFTVYERYLRRVTGNTNWRDDKFDEGSDLIKQIAKDLGIDTNTAFHFWQGFRNGILHVTWPKPVKRVASGIIHQGAAVQRRRNPEMVLVNPRALREVLLPLLESRPDMWDESSVPQVYDYE